MGNMRSRMLISVLFAGILASLFCPIPVQADPLPETAIIVGVEGHAQGFTLSCESRSAVDWAAFWDVDIREREFLAQLPRSDNPDLGFVGRPSDRWGEIPPESYGVHAAPVATLLQVYGLQAEARKGMRWDELRAEIAAGRPVIVWVIGQVWRGIPIRYKPQSGPRTTVARFEHTMILIGYSASEVVLIDAYTGEILTKRLQNFRRSWDTLGNMAVIGQSSDKEPLPVEITRLTYIPALGSGSGLASSPPEESKIYTIRSGDFLVGIARRLNVSWRRLAELNNLESPYILYPGQKLKIP